MRQSAVSRRSSFAPVLIAALAAACGRTGIDDVSIVSLDRDGGVVSPSSNSEMSPTVAASPNGATPDQTVPVQTAPGQTAPGQTAPGQTAPAQTVPSQAVPVGMTAPGTSTEPPPMGIRLTCGDAPSQQFDPASMRAYSVSANVTAAVDSTLAQMTPAHKASQMMGVDGTLRDWTDLSRSPDVEIAGVGTIAGYRYRNGSRGANLDEGQDNRPRDDNNFSTAFPAPSLRAASWDVDLERRIGAAIGDETAASRNNALLAPTMNIVRHPFWGRTQDTYGEDAYHIGRMATAFTVGAQEFVVACARHFAANNIERQRSMQNAVMTEQTLREIYTRHFEMVVQDGGIGCVMASYNLINGVKSTQNGHLLRDMLKGPIEQGGMGFEGFVISDLWAMPGDQDWPDEATAYAGGLEAVNAGLDVELPWTMYYHEGVLADADPALVEEAARRVLTQKYRFQTALSTDAWSVKPPTSRLVESSIAPNQTHEDLTEEAALKSAVLLSNGLDGNPVLPLTSATHIAVTGPTQPFSLISSSVPKSCGFVHPEVGPEQDEPTLRTCTFHFATDAALGDRGSNRVNADPERSFSPYDGMRSAGSGRNVTLAEAPEDAIDADAVVVVVGYSPADESEEYTVASGGDRSSLDLPAGHNDFVASVLDLNKPTVIVVESGSIVNLPWLSHANRNQATIWAGYPGQRGGLALGKLIFGEANFSGKMPMAWPTEAELPVFKDSETETHMGYFFGYREFDRRRYVEGAPTDVVFPFGHGLSYTTYEYSNLSLPCQSAAKDAVFNVTVDITNTGAVDGDEVAMLFVKPPPKPAGVTGQRPWKELKSFARVSVPAGQTVTAQLPLRIRDLRRWEGAENGRWIVDSGEYTILVGKNADDAETSTLVGTLNVAGD